MIDRQHGKIKIECDSCDNVHDGDSGDFQTVWDQAKSDGWTVAKIDDVWVHGCPDCGRPSLK